MRVTKKDNQTHDGVIHYPERSEEIFMVNWLTIES